MLIFLRLSMARVDFLRLISLLCLCLPLASGQAGPTNSTPPQSSGAVPVYVWYGRNGPNPPTNYSVAFLDSGAVLSSQNSTNFNLTGQLSFATDDTLSSLSAGQLAYISCDQEDYANSLLNCAQTVSAAQHYVTPIGGVILFSRYSASCTGDGIPSLNHVFTMLSASSSVALLGALNASSNGSAPVNQTGYIATMQDNNTGSGQGLYTPSASTTIAMVVLYSITGIITFLFLMVIIMGALRAHRHPERYGPRNILGLPRQSRARGMARALLDTIPIIKFGENDQTKPSGEGVANDVELAERADGEPRPKEVEAAAVRGNTVKEASKNTSGSAPTATVKEIEAGGTAGVAKEEESGKEKQVETNISAEMPPAVPGASTVQIEAALPNTPQESQEGIESCPICTEDFVRGEPARLLPCRHHFHPACIDPWLLNVSSTCPMCRVDLNPPANGADSEESSSPTTQRSSQWPYSSNSASQNATRRVFMSGLGFLNLTHMRQADPQERLEALRQIHAARQGSEPNNNNSAAAAAAEGDPARRSRISRIFHRQSGADQHNSEANNDRDTRQNRE